MKHFTQTHFLILLCVSAVGLSVSCGDKDEDKDKPKPKVMTMEAQQAAIQEAVQSALPVQLMAPPAMQMGSGGYACTGEISFLEPQGRREEMAIRYKHSCKPQ